MGIVRVIYHIKALSVVIRIALKKLQKVVQYREKQVFFKSKLEQIMQSSRLIIAFLLNLGRKNLVVEA